MIAADVFVGTGEEEEELGRFEFVALPRVGEHIKLRSQGTRYFLTVHSIFHNAVAEEGDTSGRAASVSVRTFSPGDD